MRKRLQDFTLKELVNNCERHYRCEGCDLRALNPHICAIIGHVFLMSDAEFEKKIEIDAEDEQ